MRIELIQNTDVVEIVETRTTVENSLPLTTDWPPAAGNRRVGVGPSVMAEEWNRGVDELSFQRIQRYLKAIGENTPYRRREQLPWDAAFVAFCWVKAGLHPEIAAKAMTSPYELERWAQYRPPRASWVGTRVRVTDEAVAQRPQLEPHRAETATLNLHLALDELRIFVRLHEGIVPELRKGDIILLSPGYGRPPTRVAMAQGQAKDGYIPTIEGNAQGMGPRFRRKRQGREPMTRRLHGVVKQRRPLEGIAADGPHVYGMIRPSRVDMVASLEYP